MRTQTPSSYRKPTSYEQTIYRETCYFCGARWGGCTCKFDSTCKFTWEDMSIEDPSLDCTGRFYVDPVLAYGQDFVKWIQAKFSISPETYSAQVKLANEVLAEVLAEEKVGPV